MENDTTGWAEVGIWVRREKRQAISDWKFEIGNLKLGKTPPEKAAAKQASNRPGKARAAVSNFRFQIEAHTDRSSRG